jgi:hypothetical protein
MIVLHARGVFEYQREKLGNIGIASPTREWDDVRLILGGDAHGEILCV